MLLAISGRCSAFTPPHVTKLRAEIKIWKEGELGSGDAYWFADDGMVSMTDPFDLTVVQRWIPGDGVPDDEDE
jgi:hypothetical protein|eukprot:790165-Prymnesium_polylepis.2